MLSKRRPKQEARPKPCLLLLIQNQLLCHQLVQPFRIETDHHFLADDQRRRRAALAFVNQIVHCLRIHGNVAVYEIDTSRREVGLGRAARRSTGLGEDDDSFRHAT